MIDEMIKELKSYQEWSLDRAMSTPAYERLRYIAKEQAIGRCIAIAEKYKAKEPRWIPVEERLPKYDYECVLVWLKDKCYDIAIWHSLYGFRPWYAEYFQDCPKEWENGVVAWIPLPEYTKGGAE